MENQRSFIVVDWDRYSQLLQSGDSPYGAVNLRKLGLKKTRLTYPDVVFCGLHIMADLRERNNWYEHIFEVIDKKKLMLARIKFGF